MQTPEQKLALINQLLPGDHIGVRTESVLGKAVRWFTNSSVNHSAMFIGNNLLIEASYQISIMHVNEYINDDSVEIYVGQVQNVTMEDRTAVIANAVQNYATGIFYGATGIIGLAFRFFIQYQCWRIAGLFKWFGKNILAPGHNYWCSEAYGVWWAYKNVKFTDEDVTWLTPGEIHNSPQIKQLN